MVSIERAYDSDTVFVADDARGSEGWRGEQWQACVVVELTAVASPGVHFAFSLRSLGLGFLFLPLMG